MSFHHGHPLHKLVFTTLSTYMAGDSFADGVKALCEELNAARAELEKVRDELAMTRHQLNMYREGLGALPNPMPTLFIGSPTHINVINELKDGEDFHDFVSQINDVLTSKPDEALRPLRQLFIGKNFPHMRLDELEGKAVDIGHFDCLIVDGSKERKL